MPCSSTSLFLADFLGLCPLYLYCDVNSVAQDHEEQKHIAPTHSEPFEMDHWSFKTGEWDSKLEHTPDQARAIKL